MAKMEPIKVEVEVAFAPEIKDDSWLNKNPYKEVSDVQDFLTGFKYAKGCTNFIVAASGMTAEQCYWIWSMIQHGIDVDNKGNN